MFVPGYVENQVVILETNGIGLLSIPFNSVKSLINCLMTNFTCSLERMYVMNPSWFIYSSWKLCSNFIS